MADAGPKSRGRSRTAEHPIGADPSRSGDNRRAARVAEPAGRLL